MTAPDLRERLQKSARMLGWSGSPPSYSMAALLHEAAEAVAERDALRAEVERLTRCLATANANHETFERRWYLEQARAERLAEALHRLEEACDDSDGAQYGTLGTAFVRGICKDALLCPTAAQENDDA